MMRKFERFAVASILVAFSGGLVAEVFAQSSPSRPPIPPANRGMSLTAPPPSPPPPPVIRRNRPMPTVGHPQRTKTEPEKTTSPTPQNEAPKRVSKPPKKKKAPKRRASPRKSLPPPGLPNGRPDIFPDDHADNPNLEFFIGAYQPDILLLAMEAGTSDSQINAVADAEGLNVLNIAQLDLLQMVLVRVQIGENEQINEVAERVQANNPGLIPTITPNYYYGVEAKAKGAQSIQFAPQRMSIAEAHKVATGNSVKIAIIDTGIDDNHAELSGSITDRFDAVGAAPDAPTKHGTAMAGVIAAKDQITGIAPNVEILSAQAFAPPKDGEIATGTTFAIIKSMDWAYQSGARVFNLSFAGPRDKLLIKALDALADHDTIMIGAAGNAGPGKPPAYPAAHDGVIAVTATDQNDALYTMANRGSYVAVAAPGVDIITTTPGGGYEFMSGTSIATAHITGVVALVLERHPELKASHVAQLLANASVDLGPKGIDNEFGAGLVDAVEALKSSDEMANTAAAGLTAGQ